MIFIYLCFFSFSFISFTFLIPSICLHFPPFIIPSASLFFFISSAILRLSISPISNSRNDDLASNAQNEFNRVFFFSTSSLNHAPIFFFPESQNSFQFKFKRLRNRISIPSRQCKETISSHKTCSYITPPKYWKHWKLTGVFGLEQLYKNSLLRSVCSIGSLALR